MAIYFTSDLHFHHGNMIKYSPKFRAQFKNINEMNEEMIKIWNNTISPDDTVYNLGDLSFSHNINEVISVLERLNGEHHLILGNHDAIIIQNKDILLKRKKVNGKPLLSSISTYKEINTELGHYILFHYPIFEWNRCHHGSIHLYGHVHDKIPQLKGKLLNVGLDLHMKILSEQDVHFFLDNLKEKSHHDNRKEPFNQITDLEHLKYSIKSFLTKIN